MKRGFRSASARVPTIADSAVVRPRAGLASVSRPASGVATSEVTPTLVALYVGPNSDKYLAMYAKMKEKDPDLRIARHGMVLAGVLRANSVAALSQAMGHRRRHHHPAYRRRLSLSRLGDRVRRDRACPRDPRQVGLCQVAASRIRAILANETDPDLRRIAIVQAGGVSVPGAIVGTVVLIAGIIVTLRERSGRSRGDVRRRRALTNAIPSLCEPAAPAMPRATTTLTRPGADRDRACRALRLNFSSARWRSVRPSDRRR